MGNEQLAPTPESGQMDTAQMATYDQRHGYVDGVWVSNSEAADGSPLWQLVPAAEVPVFGDSGYTTEQDAAQAQANAAVFDI